MHACWDKKQIDDKKLSTLSATISSCVKKTSFKFTYLLQYQYLNHQKKIKIKYPNPSKEGDHFQLIAPGDVFPIYLTSNDR